MEGQADGQAGRQAEVCVKDNRDPLTEHGSKIEPGGRLTGSESRPCQPTERFNGRNPLHIEERFCS
ncbi:hypothetical protein E2C01_079687 [Portunus trituberculatus]|uniref:Uncharacterized protein n=1 Tax=Portunus trituberculatus TaxID=210409 RepID=A0A5B7IR89_PORTR|nr:hypothetical protein [Portunus trituberculatus]